MKAKGLRLPLAAALLLGACASAGIEMGEPGAAASNEAARSLVERSVAAQGGNLFEQVSDLSVSFDGEWGFVAPRIQPVIADKGYRKASEERYLFASGVVFQRHRGPKGTKTVLRTPGDVEVAYDGVEDAREARRVSSALVADVYLMLITGPSFFLREGVELQALAPATIEGRSYEVLAARLRPGFGFAEEDLAQLWIDRESGLLHRVQFTLEGFAPTRGAEVDVVFSEHRRIDGRTWPTRFEERIRRPLDVFAHRWRLTGLDTDRGLEPADLSVEGLSAKAVVPAAALESPYPGPSPL